MNTARNIILLCSGIEIESPSIVPIMHETEAVEQHGPALLRHHMHNVGVSRNIKHGFSPRAELHVHQDDVGASGLDGGNTAVEAGAKVVGFHAADRVRSAGLPYNQRGLVVR